MSATTPSQNDRHLYGVIRIGGQRNFTISLEKNDLFLYCKTFWKEDNLFLSISGRGVNLVEVRFFLFSFSDFELINLCRVLPLTIQTSFCKKFKITF